MADPVQELIDAEIWRESTRGVNTPPLGVDVGLTPGDEPGAITNAAGAEIGREVAVQVPDERPRSNPWREQLRDLLESVGVDIQSPVTQDLLARAGTTDRERFEFFRDDPIGQASLAGLASNPNARLPFYNSSYGQALEAAGFQRDQVQKEEAPFSSRVGMLLAQSQKGPEVEFNDETGWAMYSDGTLVGPNGEIVYDPSKAAPGSLRWRQQVVSSWTEEEVEKWRDRLVDFGYLPKEAKKGRGVSVDMLVALDEYHRNRYLNGGKPVPATGDDRAKGRFADQPLLDYNEISKSISNSVYEQLRSMYGNEPDPAEVERWTQFVISRGMDLQRQLRRDEVSSYAQLGLQEAEETFIARMRERTAPFREAEEENTELRDALSRAAAIAGGLG